MKAKKCRDIGTIASDGVPTDSSATKSSTQDYDHISGNSDSIFGNSEDTSSTLAEEQAVQPPVDKRHRRLHKLLDPKQDPYYSTDPLARAFCEWRVANRRVQLLEKVTLRK